MKEINKLVSLVTHRLKSNYDVIDLSGNNSNPGKEQLLYNGVLEGKYPDDESAAIGMYNADIYDQRFRMLKSRLRFKLYDLLYHLDFEDKNFSDTTRLHLECTEYIHKAKVLVELKEWAMVEKQVNKALAIAEPCQLTDILLESHEIMRHVRSVLCQPTDFELTLNALEDVRRTRLLEDEAEDIFDRLHMLLTKSIHSRKINGNTAKKAVDRLGELWKESRTFNIYEHYYKLKVWHCLLENNYQGVIDTIGKVEQDCSKMKVDERRIDQYYNHYMITKAYLNLGNFVDGYKSAKAGLKFMDKSTDYWFEQSEAYFLMAMHNHDFKLADNILDEVMKNPNYKRAAEETVQRWKLFRLYLNFADMDANRLKRVRFNDAYTAANYYFKELKGYYISLLLIEFIHLLNKDRADQAMAKLIDVDNYFYKHLNDPGKNQREKQFYKLLKTLRINDFDVEKNQGSW